jgi:hypothetical protein
MTQLGCVDTPTSSDLGTLLLLPDRYALEDRWRRTDVMR